MSNVVRVMVAGAVAIAGCGGGGAAVADPDAGASDAAVAIDAWDECTPVPLVAAESDRLLLVDTSGSWARRADRWAGALDAVHGALGTSPATHALATFPRLDRSVEPPSTICDDASYAALDEAWGAAAQSIDDRLAAASLEGTSPLGPALAGAIEIARARARTMPERSTSIVLLTDATPGDDEACGTWEEAAAVAAEGFADGGPESVQVHVISVIGTAVSDDHFGRLDAIAAAGGGSVSFVNGSRADVARAAGEALATIDARGETCSLALPEGVLPARVVYAFPDGSEEVLDRVPDASFCGDAGAAFFVDDESAPRLATVCSGRAGVGGACERLLVHARSAGAPEVSATRCGI